jgi:5-methylcytosine-specific restriction endonuclease McrA
MNKEQWNAYHRVYLKKRRKEHRAKAIEFLGGKCGSCGTVEELQFHHQNSGETQTSITGVIGRWKLSRLLQLFKDENIQLLCRTCHLKFHK